MNRYYYEQEERPVSRSEKIREAKSAFSQNAGRNAGRGYGRDIYARNHYGREGEQVKPGTIDRAYVEQVLSEDGHLEGIVKQAAEVMKQVMPAK